MKSEFEDAVFNKMENRNGVVVIEFGFSKKREKALVICYPVGVNSCDRFSQSKVNLLLLNEKGHLSMHYELCLKEAEFKNLMNLVVREVN